MQKKQTVKIAGKAGISKKEVLKPEIFKGFSVKKSDLEDSDLDPQDYDQEVDIEVYVNHNYQTNITLTSSRISCGVIQLSGITDLDFLIKEKKISKEDAKKSFERMIKDIKESVPCTFIIASNTTEVRYSTVNGILDELSVSYSTEERNPNSGNKIKVWIL